MNITAIAAQLRSRAPLSRLDACCGALFALFALLAVSALASACGRDNVLIDAPAALHGANVEQPPPPPAGGQPACAAVAMACDGTNETAPAVSVNPVGGADGDCAFDALLDDARADCGADQIVAVQGTDVAGAFAQCASGALCRVQLPPGHFFSALAPVPRCTVLEGAGRGVTFIDGVESLDDAGLVSLTLAAGDYAVGVGSTLAFTFDTEIVGGYAGIGIDRAQGDLRVCNSVIRAGYVGVDVAWGAAGVLIAGSTLAACYDGVDVNWGSSDTHVIGSDIIGGENAVNVDWGSFHVEVRDSTLQGGLVADDQPDMSTDPNGPPTHDVVDENNCVVSP